MTDLLSQAAHLEHVGADFCKVFRRQLRACWEAWVMTRVAHQLHLQLVTSGKKGLTSAKPQPEALLPVKILVASKWYASELYT